jgi:hypothetical protein
MEYAHAADAAFDSISIVRCRELLGDEAEGLSDCEVDQIRQHAGAMAHTIVDIFVENKAPSAE